MTAIRAWNGSAWVEPYYNTPRPGPLAWQKYAPEVFTPGPSEWNFDVDNEGWYGSYNDGTMHSGPAEWSNASGEGGIVLKPSGPTVSQIISPTLNMTNGYEVGLYCRAGMRIWCAALSPDTASTYQNQVSVCFSGPIPNEWIYHDFTYVGEVVTLETGPLVNDHPSVDFFAQSGDDTSPFSAHILQAWIRPEPGQPPIGVTSESYIPKYWDGTQWVPQTEV